MSSKTNTLLKMQKEKNGVGEECPGGDRMARSWIICFGRTGQTLPKVDLGRISRQNQPVRP